jgi:hypothetical protein
MVFVGLDEGSLVVFWSWGCSLLEAIVLVCVCVLSFCCGGGGGVMLGDVFLFLLDACARLVGGGFLFGSVLCGGVLVAVGLLGWEGDVWLVLVCLVDGFGQVVGGGWRGVTGWIVLWSLSFIWEDRR